MASQCSCYISSNVCGGDFGVADVRGFESQSRWCFIILIEAFVPLSAVVSFFVQLIYTTDKLILIGGWWPQTWASVASLV